MTLASLQFPIPWPGVIRQVNGAITVASETALDAAGEYTCYVFAAREAMTISHVAFRTVSVSGSPTADVRIETVGTDGMPSGALWATNTNIVTATLVSNTTALHALTASASIAAGQVFAVKIAYNSGTSIQVAHLNNYSVLSNIPYQVVNTGTPTKARLSATKILALGSSTSTFYPLSLIYGATAVTHNAFDNTNSAAQGLRFQLPVPARVVGMRHYQVAQVGDFAIAIFDDAGAELSSSSTAYEGNQSGALNTGVNEHFFDNPVSLAKDTWYRAAIVATEAVNVNVSTITLLSADYRSGTAFGVNAHYTTRSSGTWTDSATTQLPLIDILLDQLDDGAGAGGGMIVHPGMTGHING